MSSSRLTHIMNVLLQSGLIVAIGLSAASAWAETGHTPPKERPATTKTAPAKRPVDARIVRAAELAGAIELRSDHVRRWLLAARRDGDDKRSRCLDDMLSQLHASERAGRAEQRAISAAVHGDRDLDAHARVTRLTSAAEHSEGLLATASACGRAVSRRVRMPTQYTVKVIVPQLPPDATIPTLASELPFAPLLATRSR
jgi:hypothetical protein